ncbi:MAG: twin-arginine translocation signal domain-containing protein, partial [Anaerolineales bacterium]|nr:twin-arginine translocation signal domain-containing protein [Anaerolineales bacterium]
MDNKLKEITEKKVSRRNFLKASGLGAAAAVALSMAGGLSFAETDL